MDHFSKGMFPVILSTRKNWKKIYQVIIGAFFHHGNPVLAILFMQSNRRNGKNSIHQFDNKTSQSDKNRNIDYLAITNCSLNRLIQARKKKRARLKVPGLLVLKVQFSVIPHPSWRYLEIPALRAAISKPGFGKSNKEQYDNSTYLLHAQNEFPIEMTRDFVVALEKKEPSEVLDFLIGEKKGVKESKRREREELKQQRNTSLIENRN
ncbi:hypothetical protein VP01_177g8 [Puccinia sorghi]|uniref:Uncharacterized protein n=1 Tax=Puccinia sorghi TaxID=27349 RepID=A0A0L6VES3_9BASI|nr:hypothetical protein VP01_177g8 [Puccinia sorghi]